MKKAAALFLAVLIFVMAAACGGAAQPTATLIPTTAPTPTVAPTPEPTPSSTVTVTTDLFKPKDEMFLVNGEPVTWEETLYWIMLNLSNVTGGGVLEDWSVEYESKSAETLIKDGAIEYAAYYRNIEAKAKEAGVELTQADRDAVEANIQSAIKQLGSAELLEAYMKNNYLTTDIYRYLLERDRLYNRLFAQMFGEKGEKCTDEEVIAFGEKCKVVNVKHLLLATSGKTEAEKAELLKTINGYLDEINAAEDKYAKFDELMKAHTEDPGIASYPNGYQYEPNTMVEVFETAAKALEIGGVSEVVESNNGYHIIIRLPIDPEAGIVGDTYGNTLRYYTAYNQYSTLAEAWYTEGTVVISDAYRDLALKDLFVITPNE